MNKLLFPIYEFRPDKISGATNLIRYNNGNWIKDDGEYDIAFISMDMPFAFYVRLPYQKNLAWSWCKNSDWRANVSKHPNGNAWHYMSRDGSNDVWGEWNREKHPNTIAGNMAMYKCCEMRGCANGRSVEFNVNDKTIKNKLLRLVESKEIINPPKIFECCYCGNHNWESEESQ